MATTTQSDTDTQENVDESPTPNAPAAKAVARAKSRRPLLFGILGFVVLAALVFIVRFVIWSSGHVSTDDATITTDVIQIAPQETGNVMRVVVLDDQHVKAGDLLVELDSASYQTAYLQAKANLDLAVAAAQGAKASVSLTRANGSAGVTQATGVLGFSTRGVENSVANVSKARSSVLQARAQDMGATATSYAAQANVAIAIANKQKALDAVAAASAQVDTSGAAVRTSQANVDAALATADNATKQATRNDILFRQGAISGQTADQTRAAAGVAVAQVNAARENLAQAQSTLVQMRANLRSAQSQLPGADAAVSQARSQYAAARESEMAMRETVHENQADVAAAQASVRQARQRQKQATGQLAEADTVPIQVAVSEASAEQADAKVEQARAALRDAQINLDRTKVYAPCDGTISKKTVEIGDLVQPGGTMMSLVPDEDAWVTANFKETQLQDVRAGERADIDVDAFPGTTFHGQVSSIAAGTGSTFALLPADNSTGNFTKVVQRVPIKIVLDHGQPGMSNLRSGMSVIATITTTPSPRH